MTYENFLMVALQLQKQHRVLQELNKNHVDLVNFVDPYHSIISILIEEVYGEQGLGWFEWFCYENDFGQKGLEAWDKDKNPICYSFESLWKYLETNHKI